MHSHEGGITGTPTLAPGRNLCCSSWIHCNCPCSFSLPKNLLSFPEEHGSWHRESLQREKLAPAAFSISLLFPLSLSGFYLQTLPFEETFRKCTWTGSTESQTFPTGLHCPKQRSGPSLCKHSRDFPPKMHQLVTQKPWHIYPTGQGAAVSDKPQAQHSFHPWVPIHGPVNNICNACERNPCPAPQGFDFHCSRDAVHPQKSQVRIKGLDALGQRLLKQLLQLCKSFKLTCCIICQDFYNSWKGSGEKHLFSFFKITKSLWSTEMKALKRLCIKEIRISCI